MIGLLSALPGTLGAIVLCVLLLVSLWWLIRRRERYRPAAPSVPQRMLPTSEVHIDPETGRRERVWVDAATGARAFVDEAGSPAEALPIHEHGAPPVPHAVGWAAPPRRIVDAPPPPSDEG